MNISRVLLVFAVQTENPSGISDSYEFKAQYSTPGHLKRDE